MANNVFIKFQIGKGYVLHLMRGRVIYWSMLIGVMQEREGQVFVSIMRVGML